MELYRIKGMGRTLVGTFKTLEICAEHVKSDLLSLGYDSPYIFIEKHRKKANVIFTGYPDIIYEAKA